MTDILTGGSFIEVKKHSLLRHLQPLQQLQPGKTSSRSHYERLLGLSSQTRFFARSVVPVTLRVQMSKIGTRTQRGLRVSYHHRQSLSLYKVVNSLKAPSGRINLSLKQSIEGGQFH